jgi:hypothetical protein
MPVRESAIPNKEPNEMIGYSRVSTVLVAIVVALLTSACTVGPSAPPTAARGATPQAMPLGEVDLKAGTYAFDFPLLDTAEKPFPNVVITVPEGWRSYKGFVVRSRVDTAGEIAISFWNVVDVYAHSCHWLGPMIHPGPTVDELAAVLAARPIRNATAPVAVSLGGYQGKSLEWSVPVDLNFSECDKDPGGTQSFVESWTGYGTGGSDRYQQAPGQVDRLWILDVEGRRLVIDADYRPGSTGQDRAELATIVNSITFQK